MLNNGHKQTKFLMPLLAALGLSVALFSACSKEEDRSPIVIEKSVPVKFYTMGEISTKEAADGHCVWRMDSLPDPTANYILQDTTSATVRFIPITAGTYMLSMNTMKDEREYKEVYTVRVSAPEKEPSPYIAKIFEILPAPGQFTNQLPLYRPDGEEWARWTDYMKWTERSLVGKAKGDLISLGGFGGYIIFGFDHTILNVPGLRDFRVDGNAFFAAANPNPNAPKKGGSCEPGIIEVAYDKNKNGKPDDGWYEIAGSEYNNPKAIRNYEITYYRPETEEKDADYDPEKTFVTIKKYIRWEDNQGHSGYLEKNTWHNQSYYPGWVKEDKLTFRGTRLPDNAVEESGEGKYWVQYCFDYGYVDNLPNGDIDNAVDIDWAVDKDGKKVHLPGIDFVRVYCAMRQECGWLGETSTEIQGATDLHLRGIRLKTNGK